MTTKKLRIIHETNPKKYFPALYNLEENGLIKIVGQHRYSVLKEWLRAGLKDKTPLLQRTKNSIQDLIFRSKILFIKNEIIVIGFAPWDWRILIYSYLTKKNKVLYHTSWHDWSEYNTPRQPKFKFLRKFLIKKWLKFLHAENSTIISVTSAVSESLKNNIGLESKIIPHAVPQCFFNKALKREKNKNKPLRIIFVGEISEKKGIEDIIKIAEYFTTDDIKVTVVGDGPMAHVLNKSGEKISYLGKITERKELAEVMAQNDILILMSKKTKTWEELFGIVLIEALASGCAVLASNHIGPRGILGDADDNGLFEEDDLNGVLKYLEKIIEDRNLLNLLLKNQNVADKYSISSVEKEWKKAILER